MKTMSWKCTACKTKWAHPLDGTVPAGCPKCWSKQIFDINVSPVSASELKALGLPEEWAAPPTLFPPAQYHTRHQS